MSVEKKKKVSQPEMAPLVCWRANNQSVSFSGETRHAFTETSFMKTVRGLLETDSDFCCVKIAFAFDRFCGFFEKLLMRQ